MNKKKKLKIVLLSVGIPVAILAVAVIAVVWYISVRLYTGSVPIVKRQDVYIAPTEPESTLKLHEYSGEILTDEEGNQYYTDETGEHPGMTVEEAAAKKETDKVETEEQTTEPEQTEQAEEPEEHDETESPKPEITQPETFPITSTPSSLPSSSSSSSNTKRDPTYDEMFVTYYDAYYEPKSDIPIYKKAQKDPNIINIMLLGRDAHNAKYERGRTDAMIILSFNKVKKTAKLISLQRDTLIPIEGHDWDRINTPYTFGGVGLTLNTLNDVFDLDLQYYVIIDFSGILHLIDKIGGVDITLTQTEADYYKSAFGYSEFTAGVNHMTGEQALIHARNRKTGSDYARPRRQRDVLIAAYNKVVNSTDMNSMVSLVDYALTQLSTNIPLTDLMSLAGTVLSESGIDISTSAMPYEGTHETVWYKKKMVSQIDITENTRLLHEEIWGAE